MIQSMTGYGAAQQVADGACYVLELRSLNNRYLKLSTKLPEPLQFLEQRVERLVRNRLGRGSVTYTLRVRHEVDAGTQPINLEAMQAYVNRIASVSLPAGVQATIELATVAMLPGVCEAPPLDDEARARHEAVVDELSNRAIDALIGMRRHEGESLAGELRGLCQTIRTRALVISGRAPRVVEEYHQRLRSRVQLLMQAGGFELEADGLMREVAIYAERCDIAEEVSRLTSHLDQFAQLCERGEHAGRTLDFLTQELLREANTIASKSNDAEITQNVVEIKGLIDRLREQVQNVE